jgi:hypothetical protein
MWLESGTRWERKRIRAGVAALVKLLDGNAALLSEVIGALVAAADDPRPAAPEPESTVGDAALIQLASILRRYRRFPLPAWCVARGPAAWRRLVRRIVLDEPVFSHRDQKKRAGVPPPFPLKL